MLKRVLVNGVVHTGEEVETISLSSLRALLLGGRGVSQKDKIRAVCIVTLQRFHATS